MGNNQEYDKKKRKKSLLLFVLLFLTGTVWWYLNQQTSDFDSNAHSYNDPVKKGENWSTGQLVIPGFGDIPVESTDKNIKIILGNSKLNEAYLKYKVVVIQARRKITILDSKLIKPGNAITKVSTNKLMMKKGIYPMIISVHAYSLKNKEAPLNSSTIDSKLIIN